MSGRVVKTSMVSLPQREPDPGARRAADPVALHQLQGVRPVQPVQVGQQAVGVGGDPHHPLGQRTPEHGEVAALGPAVRGDLLVGQHGAQPRAPVDRCLVQVGQPVRVDDLALLDVVQLGPRPARRVGPRRGLPRAGIQLGDQLVDATRLAGGLVEPRPEDLQEDPLGPLVVAGVDRRERPAVVVVDTQPAQLRADGLDVGLGRDPRVLPGLDGELLGGQAEGVVAHRVQDVVAVHAPEAARDVGTQVAQRVPDVQPGPRGVREHVHREVLGPVGDLVEARAQPPDGVGRVERPLGLPPVLPRQLDLLGQGRRVAVRRLVGGLAHRGAPGWWNGGGHKKTPHAGGVAVLSERFRSARPGKEEPPGHGVEPTATGPDQARRIPVAGLTRPGEVSSRYDSSRRDAGR